MTSGRRKLLLAGAACAAGVDAAGLAVAGTGARAGARAGVELAATEARFGGRLGVYAVDTGTGATVGHRAGERFLICSTAKVPLAALVLHRALTEPGLLVRRIRYGRDDLVANSPVTSARPATGMTVGELCAAAVSASDNTAANLLHDLVGRPAAVTAFLRGLGDPLSRLDDREPMPASVASGDERNTTTPRWFAHDLRALTLGDTPGARGVLGAAGRRRLVDSMRACTTGDGQIRAGVPAQWHVGDKTGACSQEGTYDVAVLWPSGRAPIVLAVCTGTPTRRTRTPRSPSPQPRVPSCAPSHPPDTASAPCGAPLFPNAGPDLRPRGPTSSRTGPTPARAARPPPAWPDPCPP